MADLRFDPLNQYWVAIARNRMQRPSEYVPLEQIQKQLVCPFCRGYEDETPESLAIYGRDGEPVVEDGDWLSRVFPNKFPSFGEEQPAGVESGPFPVCTGLGSQEILVPSPRHVDSFADLTPEETRVAMVAAQARLQVASRSEAIEHTMLFMNCRSAAGASLSHIHLQLIGTPVVSPYLEGLVSRNLAEFNQSGQTLISKLAAWELEQRVRVVSETENFIAYCPFASRFPLQVNIAPRLPTVPLVELASEPLFELGQLCHQLVGMIEVILEKPAYNILFQTPPSSAGAELQSGAWYVEIFPRITRAAGFEWGTNTWVNPVSPESAAKRMKAVQNESVR